MMRLRCIDCRSLIAAFDTAYETTERDNLDVMNAVAKHIELAACSGMLAVDHPREQQETTL